jgi:hypothetical protein
MGSTLTQELYSFHNSSCSHVEWCKFFIHLRSLNDCHIGTVEAMTLKIWLRGHLQWHDLLAEFHENLPTGSKLISGGHKEGQTDSMVMT